MVRTSEDTEDMIEYEAKICTGCLPPESRTELKINLDPRFLLSPHTPINLFVHQDLVPRIHECKARDLLRANIWQTTKIRIPVSKVAALKATNGIEPGPPTTDPERRYNANETR